MRVVIAPDKFAGTLSASEAARAIATGWARQAPDDELVTVAMSDGGPGFVEVVHAALGGDLVALTVPGPYGDPVPATVLRVGNTAYVESAQAIGLHLHQPADRQPERASSFGVGSLVRAALEGGAHRVVVGLGGSATNDGGVGALAALGAQAPEPEALVDGPRGLARLTSLDLAPAKHLLAGVELVAASDVDNPLLGIRGATKTFGPQKGLAQERLVVVDGWLQHLADLTDRKVAGAKGAGAAGGLGYALLLLGATREPGVALVAEAVGLAEELRDADLVVTGEGSFDFSTRSGKVPYGVAELAAATLTPCIALAGRMLVSNREMRALGVESAYSMIDLAGEKRALHEPAAALADLAERVARTWSRQE
ncbi:MAG: glycerate kinase [Actinomycetota bacterium]|nr:glycerate kinase [Actinomycetota bacterium]